jgi:hypothetical protein
MSEDGLSKAAVGGLRTLIEDLAEGDQAVLIVRKAGGSVVDGQSLHRTVIATNVQMGHDEMLSLITKGYAVIDDRERFGDGPQI